MRRPRGILWRDLCGGGLDTLLFRADRECDHVRQLGAEPGSAGRGHDGHRIDQVEDLWHANDLPELLHVALGHLLHVHRQRLPDAELQPVPAAKAKDVYGYMYLLTIASASVLFFTGSAISFIRAKRAGMSPKTEPAAE